MSGFLLVFLLLQEAIRPWNHHIGQMGWHWHIGWVWKQVMQFNVWIHEQRLDALLCFSQKLSVKYIGHVDKLVTMIFWMEWPFYWNQTSWVEQVSFGHIAQGHGFHFCVCNWAFVTKMSFLFCLRLQVPVPSCVGLAGALLCVTPSCWLIRFLEIPWHLSCSSQQPTRLQKHHYFFFLL